MKKKIGLLLGMLALSVSLIACGGNTGEASTEIDGFTKVSSKGDLAIYKHNETNCYYTVFSRYKVGGNITQMFIEKNNMSIPYCE